MTPKRGKNQQTMATTNSKRSKLTHYMKAPFRALIRARDLYVSGMGGCAGRVQRGRVISSAAARSRSHGFYNSRNSTTSASSPRDDYNELMRAISQGRLGALKDPNPRGVVPRSQSMAVGVGISRIDEDQPCDFSDGYTYPRSQSYAVEDQRWKVGVDGT